MKLLFKQRMFSWLCSYDVFDEAGQTVYTVKGELSWGYKLRIYDANGQAIGCVQQKVLSWLPQFDMYLGDEYIGSINREFTFFKPKYNIFCKGWQVEGDWCEWDYNIVNAQGQNIATIKKEIWNWTDTYSIEVSDYNDALTALMLVLAIDAEKCSRDN